MTFAPYLALLCSLGFLAIGWQLRGWHVAAQKRRADAQREREFEAIMRLAAEEEAEAAGRQIDWWDAKSGTVRRVSWTGPRLTSYFGGNA
jgi:hypothetical protein